jgi:hypothetical protein
MILFIWARPTMRFSGLAHVRLRPAPHSLSLCQPGPSRQPRRRAPAEIEARRPRAQQPGRGRSGRGRDASHRSEPGPTCPAPHGIPATGPHPLSAVPHRPLKREPLAVSRFFSPRAVCLVRPHSSAVHSSTTTQESASPASHHRSPSSASDSARASPPSTPTGVHPPSCSVP